MGHGARMAEHHLMLLWLFGVACGWLFALWYRQ